MKTLYLLVLILVGLTLPAQSVPEIGVVQEVENDSLLHAAGFQLLVESTPTLLSPRTVTEEQFQHSLATLRSLRVPVYACNLFLPGDLKVVGPAIDEVTVLGYVDTVLRRAHEAGLTLITWGSSGSRRVPEGFDRARAQVQFITMAGKVARIAARYDILLALENLNRTEANFINTVPEALDIVKAVDHPNFRLCVDIYHMLVDGDPASDITGVGDYAVYCELAEGKGRTPPGVQGVDFTPYLAALKQEGYTGKVVVECRWEDLAEQGAEAYGALLAQVRAVFKNKN